MHKAERQTLSAVSTAGQTMIFMIMALLILAVVIVWVFDVHTVLYLKARTQNAGDAAALAAARWQGISLNLIGDLNILQALALSRGDTTAAAQITDVQARLCFVGPLVGLLASQQAAKNNRAYVNPDYMAILMEHVADVSDYADFFPEPYTNAWPEYAGMLANIAEQGVAAGPDNTWYFIPPITDLPRNFYEAVASLDWCWFYWNDPGILQSYSGYQDWPDPPTNPPPNTFNCEVFGLGLLPFTTVLPGGAGTVERMNQISSERGISPETISNEVAGITNTWYGYAWTSWSALAPDNNFPILPLQVKPEYDYAGADAVIRVEATADPRMPTVFPGIQPFLIRSAPSATRLTQSAATAGAITWTAAAKPFGYLAADGSPVRPDAYAIVLPAFHNVRLIPVDAASGSNIGAYDIDWHRHNKYHMQIYWESGPAGLEADCWYCQQLQTWEDPAFRQQGIDWLNDTNHTCDQVVGGGGGPGGGTRRGH
ncbi:MAG: pilus assembly protein TadG-related protein [Kiritimatiellae bacterium]|nr:pilus assembly protein TadG-related protein [Kiritimatiellia bacterium]